MRREEEVFNKKDWEGRERKTVTGSRADLVEQEHSQVWLSWIPCSSSLSFGFPFLFIYLWIIWLGMDVRRYRFAYDNFQIACELFFFPGLFIFLCVWFESIIALFQLYYVIWTSFYCPYFHGSYYSDLIFLTGHTYLLQPVHRTHRNTIISSLSPTLCSTSSIFQVSRIG